MIKNHISCINYINNMKTNFESNHMGSEGRLYSSKSTNGGKGLQNSKINSYFTP